VGGGGGGGVGGCVWLHDDSMIRVPFCLRVPCSIPQCNYDVLFAYLTSHNYDFAYVLDQRTMRPVPNTCCHPLRLTCHLPLVLADTTSPIPCARAATFARRCSTVSSLAFGKPQNSDDVLIWVACLTFVFAPCSQRFRCTQWHKRKIRAS